MTRFNIALLTLLLPSVLAAPSRHLAIVPGKRNNDAGSYDVDSNYGAAGTGTGIPLSTGLPISILSSSSDDAAADPSAAPVDCGSDGCPATTTITSTNIVTETETVIPATGPAQTQASGSSAAGSAASTFPAGPYGNATDGSSRYAPGPTGTAGSTGRSSRHGHRHKHKTHSFNSTTTSVAEAPASTSILAESSSYSSAADSSSSEVITSDASNVVSAVQVTSTSASPTVGISTSSDQPLAPTSASSTTAVPDPTSASSSSSTRVTSADSTSAGSTSAAGGEFYQAPTSKTTSSSAFISSSSSSFSSSAPVPSSSVPSSSAPSSSASTSSVPPSTMAVPSSTSTTSTSSTSTGVTATAAATPNSKYTANTGTGKRGLAYNAAGLTTCFNGASEVSWAYNWASSSSGLSSAFEYVPMLWGTQSDHTNTWQSAATAAIASGSKHLLSFNEPDLASQSNLSPAAAAAGHRTYLQPFAGRAKLSAPAITNAGLAWLEQFLVDCASCTIDFVPVHWYDSATNVAYFKWYITSAIAAAKGRPIWITEFGASGTQAQQVAFLQEVMPWLDGQAAVERYAYFGVFSGVLVSGTGLSALGQTFATYT